MDTRQASRPIYFMVPFWGQRYREYFVDLCLPSLLAPANLPLLNLEDGHRFLIATTREDWDAIATLPIMARLRQHATPTWIEIEAAKNAAPPKKALVQYVSTVRLQTVAQRKLVEAAYKDGAFGSLLFPDVIYSDGMVASLLKSIEAGDQLVVFMALRQTEETVLAELTKLGYLQPDRRPSTTAEAINLPPRFAADLAVRHLHPEIRVFEDGNPAQPIIQPFTYWRMPNQSGLLFHTYFGAPALMDFRVVDADHTDCLDAAEFEHIYINRNFAACDRIRIISDSDDFMLLSLTPAKTNWSALRYRHRRLPEWARSFLQLCSFRASFQYYTNHQRDALRVKLHSMAVRWHGGDIDDAWLQEERRIARSIDHWSRVNSSLADIAVALLLRYEVLRARFMIRSLIVNQLALAFRGDSVARKRILRGIRVLTRQLFDPADEPAERRAK